MHYGRQQLLRAPFLDLERVEVLRGPQSILFGKNSVAGALNMVTAKPTDEFEGRLSGKYSPDGDITEFTGVDKFQPPAFATGVSLHAPRRLRRHGR